MCSYCRLRTVSSSTLLVLFFAKRLFLPGHENAIRTHQELLEPVFVSVSTPSPSGASHSTPTSHPDYLPFLCFPFPGLWLFSYPACLTTLKKIQISLHFPDFGSFCGLSYSESVGVQERVMLGCFGFSDRVPSFQGNCKYRPSEFSFPRTAATRRLPSAHLPHTVTYRSMRGVHREIRFSSFAVVWVS